MEEQNKIKQTIRTLRRALNITSLDEASVSDDPFTLFEQWMADALAKESFEPNCMTLATSSKDGKPSARTVLLKDYSPQGFVFFTNYNSRKGHDLKENQRVSLVFYWGILSRQILIDGVVEQTPREVSVEYFHSRPRKSQIAALISEQSRQIKSRKELEDAFAQAQEKYKDQEIPCPENWGGYVVIPNRIEFWQGQADRLHDRVCFTLNVDASWEKVRLAP